MSPESEQLAPRKSNAATRVGNGSAILAGVDGRTLWARRLRELITAHISDLGGPDVCSEAERSLVRRAAALEVELERLEARFASSGDAGPSPKALDLYQRMAGNLRRLLEAVGLQRRARDTTPDALEYANRVEGDGGGY